MGQNRVLHSTLIPAVLEHCYLFKLHTMVHAQLMNLHCHAILTDPTSPVLCIIGLTPQLPN